MVISVLFCGIFLLGGCKKKTEQPASAPAMEKVPVAAAAVEQTTCPVLGGAIDKNVYVDYQGKRVYFCCTECKAAFEKEPAKYLSKLPQFAK